MPFHFNAVKLSLRYEYYRVLTKIKTETLEQNNNTVDTKVMNKDGFIIRFNHTE